MKITSVSRCLTVSGSSSALPPSLMTTSRLRNRRIQSKASIKTSALWTGSSCTSGLELLREISTENIDCRSAGGSVNCPASHLVLASHVRYLPHNQTPFGRQGCHFPRDRRRFGSLARRKPEWGQTPASISRYLEGSATQRFALFSLAAARIGVCPP